MKPGAIWAVSLLIGGAGLVQAEQLGRLLYSPQERARLETARAAGGPRTGQEAVGRSATLNGVVTRSDGRRTMWLDGLRTDHTPGVVEDRVLRARVGRPVRLEPLAREEVSRRDARTLGSTPAHPPGTTGAEDFLR